MLAGGLAAGCVTTYEEDPSLVGIDWTASSTRATQPPSIAAVPIVIGDPAAPVDDQQRMLLDLYHSVLGRMQAAVADRDVDALGGLLEAYDRPGLPDPLRGRLDGYQALRCGLAFERHALAAASLAAVDLAADANASSRRRWELVLPATANPVRLGGRDDEDPLGFAVEVTVDDLFVDGSRHRTNTQDFAWLPAAVDLIGDNVVRVPIELDLPIAADAVRREVHVRIDLMPGYVFSEGRRAPVQRTPLGAVAATHWPVGHELVRAKPLVTLREAIRRGDAAHFRHLFLAALFVPTEERDTAMALLIEQVRYARAAPAQVAMAALRELSGVDCPLGDREAWLAWWQTRR
jgi:hypothetical protein